MEIALCLPKALLLIFVIIIVKGYWTESALPRSQEETQNTPMYRREQAPSFTEHRETDKMQSKKNHSFPTPTFEWLDEPMSITQMLHFFICESH